MRAGARERGIRVLLVSIVLAMAGTMEAQAGESPPVEQGHASVQIVVHVPEGLPEFPHAATQANQSRSLFLGSFTQNPSPVLLSVGFGLWALAATLLTRVKRRKCCLSQMTSRMRVVEEALSAWR